MTIFEGLAKHLGDRVRVAEPTVAELQQRLQTAEWELSQLRGALNIALPVLRQAVYRAPDDVSANALNAASVLEAIMKGSIISSPLPSPDAELVQSTSPP